MGCVVQTTENTWMSPDFNEFYEALELLFIPANTSGRNKFSARWPAAALKIFGPELMACDTKGGLDRVYRSELEEEAEDRRLALLALLEGLEEKSIMAGSLKMEFIQNVITQYGADCALYVYQPQIVSRVAGAHTIAGQGGDPQSVNRNSHPAATSAEDDFVPHMPDDPFADVQPISVETSESL